MREIFRKIADSASKPKNLLVLADVLLVFFLILLSNFGILPIKNLGDFLFFSFIFLILALYRPSWSFLFFVGTIAIENINVAPDAIGITVRPYQFFAVVTILAVLGRLAVGRLNFKLPKFSWIDALPVIFAISGFISVLGSINKGISLKQSIIAASFVAIYFLTRIFVQNLEDLKKIIPFFLSSSTVVVSYGIWQNVRFAHGLNSFETMPGRPNGTFTEADWLGIFLVFLLAVTYALIYFLRHCHSERTLSELGESKGKLKNLIQNNFIRSLDKLGMTSLLIFLTLILILLIITVSRSAWLGALIVTVFYLLIIFTNLKLIPRNWQWKKTFNIKIRILVSLIISIAIVYFFNLTSFQLFNRVQSTGTGLQKITISCKEDISLPDEVGYSEELIRYGCRHINLEEISFEQARGYYIKEIFRKDPNINIRTEIYQKSWQEIKRNPVLGIGWGNISLILGKDERGAGLNSSNIFLEVWLGAGILGLFAFILAFLYILVKGIKLFANDNPGGACLGLFLFLGALALLIPNLFNAGVFLGILWLFFGISNISAENKV